VDAGYAAGVRALFEATGTRVPDDLVRAADAMKPGRFVTPLGNVIATYKPAAGTSIAQYSLEFDIPEPAPAR
jgi:hypothetical protein